jgi:hypothetical protein
MGIIPGTACPTAQYNEVQEGALDVLIFVHVKRADELFCSKCCVVEKNSSSIKVLYVTFKFTSAIYSLLCITDSSALVNLIVETSTCSVHYTDVERWQVL